VKKTELCEEVVFQEKPCSNIEEKINWLRLIRSENLGPQTFYQLIEKYGSASIAIEALLENSFWNNRKKPIKLSGREQAEKEIEACQKIGAKIITSNEAAYPYLLSFIPNPPPVVTILGNTDIFKHDSMAMVGARNASASGCKMAYQMSHELSEKNLVIVSGLARGIDTAAHRGSLANGTIAVVAGGVDIIYPRENEKLYSEIAEKGVVIAELPIGTTPRAENFPQRNRIISGLSLGTLVIEAAGRSGSLITARFAAEQGREVMAVPGSPFDPRSEGPNKLIKQGAALITCTSDVMECLPYEIGIKLNELPKKKSATATPFLQKQDGLQSHSKIIEKIGTTPVEIDEIVASSGINISTVLSVLLELEMAGRLERHPGGKVSLL